MILIKKKNKSPETTLKGPIYYRMVNVTVLFSWGSQANKLESSANKMSSARYLYHLYTTRKTGAQDGSLGDITTDRLWRGAMNVKLNKLQPVWGVVPNPVHGHVMDTIAFELVKKGYYDQQYQREQGKRQWQCSLRSRARDIFSYGSIKANEVEWFFLNPNWFGNSVKTLCRMLDITFQFWKEKLRISRSPFYNCAVS